MHVQLPQTIPKCSRDESTCAAAILVKAALAAKLNTNEKINQVFVCGKDGNVQSQNKRKKDTKIAESGRSSILISEAETPAEKEDGRAKNRGSSFRYSYTSRDKVNFVESVNDGMDTNSLDSVSQYFREALEGTTIAEVDRLSNRYYKWSKPDVYEACMRDLLSRKKNDKGKLKKRASLTRSPYQAIETELYKQFTEQRRAGRKVSSTWIRLKARTIFEEKKRANPGLWASKEFRGSYRWMRRFIKRKNIKFRRRKCGKEKTAEECIPEFEQFMSTLRFDFLPPREDGGAAERDPLWGRFPPELRYNMDQVPLPFVCMQDDTYTMEEDKDVNIKCPKESLRKRQFTMHQVFNAGVGDDAHGWCDMVVRGTGKRISQGEKNLYDDDVDVFWQKKAWVDAEVMKKLAKTFVQKKNEKHGDDVWVILFCDNLGAHLDAEVKRIFGDGKVLLFYFPPNMTNFIQPIDAGLGRTVRRQIGHCLDTWLMEAENMERWEATMTAGERRILSIGFVADAMRMVMEAEYDAMRIGCFERTGCLMTLIPNEAHDNRIHPQGMNPNSFTIPSQRIAGAEEQANDDIEDQDEEAAAVQAEQGIIDEEGIEEEEIEYVLENDNTIEVEDSDDGREIDDNPESANDDN